MLLSGDQASRNNLHSPVINQIPPVPECLYLGSKSKIRNALTSLSGIFLLLGDGKQILLNRGRGNTCAARDLRQKLR